MATPTTCAERRLLSVVALTLIALVAGGCGSRHRTAPAGARGRDVFAKACAGCHSLSGHDTHTTGGDLALAPLSARDIASFVRVMPVDLDPAQVAAVAAYVHATARRVRGIQR